MIPVLLDVATLAVVAVTSGGAVYWWREWQTRRMVDRVRANVLDELSRR